MVVSFDQAPKRPEHIENILNGLDRYNPETTLVFQDYVQQQCEEGTYDAYANLALLKLCVYHPLFTFTHSLTFFPPSSPSSSILMSFFSQQLDKQ